MGEVFMRKTGRIAIVLVLALMLQSLTGFCGTSSVSVALAKGTSYRIEGTVTADYLNLRSINIGYQIPKQLLNYVYLKSARLSFAVENLFMLKARQGLNPMAQFNGLVYNEYMPSRNFTFALNVSF